MILGLDLHGVISANPEKFRNIAKEIRRDGGKVFIITGMKTSNPELYNLLKRVDFTEYDEIYSIIDTLNDEGLNPISIINGEEMYFSEDWDKCKSRICAKLKVNLHIDDSDIYGKYFTTPYGYFNGEEIEITL